MIKFDSSNSNIEYNYNDYYDKLSEIYNSMLDKSAKGSDYLGWNDYLHSFDFTLIDKIEQDIMKLQDKAPTMLVIGIGGSYLGSLALEKALRGMSLNQDKKLLYVGNNLSSDYISEIYEYCQNNDFVINVISKSGSTLEPSLAFRIFEELLIDKYGEKKAREHIVITTDSTEGALKKYADKYEVITYKIPQDIGGRYSVFSPVGLIPLAFVNIKLHKLIKGAIQGAKDCFKKDEYNVAFDYALCRYLQYQNNRKVEAMVVYEPCLASFIEWYKQLFAESEGKDGKGLLPIGFIFSTDLHSLGQYIQDGPKLLFETVIKVKNSRTAMKIPQRKDDIDHLNSLTSHDLSEINNRVIDSVVIAHSKLGDVPSLILEMEQIDEENMGYLMSFMLYVCAYSAYLLDVNPFNQPGVEVYKNEIKKIL